MRRRFERDREILGHTLGSQSGRTTGSMNVATLRLGALVVSSMSLLSLASCGGGTPAGNTSASPAEAWLSRAKANYKSLDMDDAVESARSALKAAPESTEAHTLLARISLARLEFGETLRALEGVAGTEAHTLRGRAFWYLHDTEHAAEELDAELSDVNTHDGWAREVVKLARKGHGRKPFSREGSSVAMLDMPEAGPLNVVPIDIDGEPGLALVATGIGELTLDASTRKDPAWVTVGFGPLVRVKDVPALTQDLSALSKQLGAPIKALLGVHLLRQLHPTFDRRAGQFIVRASDPNAHPDSTKLTATYERGGGMTVRLGLGAPSDAPCGMRVDSSAPYPIGLTNAGWLKAGVPVASLEPEPQLGGSFTRALIPMIHAGSFELPKIPGIGGGDLAGLVSTEPIDLCGVMGAGFMQAFRVTITDGGRALWLEADPTMGTMVTAATPAPAATAPTATPAVSPTAPARKKP